MSFKFKPQNIFKWKLKIY